LISKKRRHSRLADEFEMLAEGALWSSTELDPKTMLGAPSACQP
jgi:hypothetical protein